MLVRSEPTAWPAEEDQVGVLLPELEPPLRKEWRFDRLFARLLVFSLRICSLLFHGCVWLFTPDVNRAKPSTDNLQIQLKRFVTRL